MRVIDTSIAKPSDLSPWEREQVYNGLDCCITAEILDELLTQLDPQTTATYTFSRELQAPVLEMGLRGILVDARRKSEVVDSLYDLLDRLERNLERIVLDGVGLLHFNWRSYPDLRHLFYDRLGIPAVTRKGTATVDRAAMEKMAEYLVARPIIAHILAMRDIGKKLGFLKAGIDADGRMRCSYNIAGTSTGRFSSSYSEFGTGTNLQNIEKDLRSIFISDPGMKFAKFDAKSGESYCVGAIEWNLFKDGRYLDACETGDPHTATARICWPDVAWTGKLALDRVLADQTYYRHHSRRDMCKKLGHGSNYGGEPPTLSRAAQLPLSVVLDFQPKYFRAYPAHLQWHHWVDRAVRTDGYLVNLTGRRRYFFGRRDSRDTLREAIAYDPQGSLADIVNMAMLRIWRAGTAELKMQDHDALTFQFPEEREDEVVPQLMALLPVRVELKHGRTLEIPYDCQTGWNKGHYDAKTNPDGLKDYRGKDERRRTPPVSFLDRRVHRAHR
jgi:DNA polymerase I-like protein with 3'-5' exonuclease and polymerase domains